MESNNSSIFNFELNETSKSHIQGIAQWAKITAIIAFVSVGLSLLSSVILISKYSSGSGFGSGLVGWIVSIMMNIILLGVSKSLVNAVLHTDQDSLNKGFSDLAKYLRIMGILCIIIGAVLVIAFLIALVAGAAGGFR
jgi:hypothetical protein